MSEKNGKATREELSKAMFGYQECFLRTMERLEVQKAKYDRLARAWWKRKTMCKQLRQTIAAKDERIRELEEESEKRRKQRNQLDVDNKKLRKRLRQANDVIQDLSKLVPTKKPTSRKGRG